MGTGKVAGRLPFLAFHSDKGTTCCHGNVSLRMAPRGNSLMLVCAWPGVERVTAGRVENVFVTVFTKRLELIGLKWPREYSRPSSSKTVIDLIQWMLFWR